MAKFVNISIVAVIERLKQFLNISSDLELSNYLGISQPLIANWRQRNSFDVDLIIAKCNDINLNWLLLGEEPAQEKSANLLFELKKLKKENEELKTKINDMKDVIVDLSINNVAKKREPFGSIKHKDPPATILK